MNQDHDPTAELHEQLVEILSKLMDSELSTYELTILCVASGVRTSELMGAKHECA